MDRQTNRHTTIKQYTPYSSEQGNKYNFLKRAKNNKQVYKKNYLIVHMLTMSISNSSYMFIEYFTSKSKNYKITFFYVVIFEKYRNSINIWKSNVNKICF